MLTFLRIQKERIIRAYYRLLWWRPLWLFVLNGRNHRLHRKHAKALSAEQTRIVKELREKGIAASHVSALFGEARWQELRNMIENKLAEPKIEEQIKNRRLSPVDRGDKYFNVNLWENQTVDLSHPFVRFCLSDTLLEVANEYMDMWVKWRGGRLWATLPVPAGAAPNASQRWHRDPEDTKMLKLFIYFNDIDHESGPFTYVQGSQLGGKWRHLFPQIPPIGSYPPDGAVEAQIPAEDIRTMTAPAGTLLFCDTSGLHRGGYATGKPRYMSQTIYASRATNEPISYCYPKGWSSEGLSDIARYAVKN